MARTSNEGSPRITHEAYPVFAPMWQKLLDVYEGTGGFLDPAQPYIVPHPREMLDHSVAEKDANGNPTGRMVPNPNPINPSPKLRMRRKLARYHNIAKPLIEKITGGLFLQSPTRSFANDKENPKIRAFWNNCDGKGTDMTTFMRQSFTISAVFGHAVHLMEKPNMTPMTRADQGLPYICRYTPIDWLHWLEDEDGNLTQVKLKEIAPLRDFNDVTNMRRRERVRIVTEEEWRLYDSNGQLLAGDEGRGVHGFDTLPVQVLYPVSRLLLPFIGQPLLGDPQNFITLHNLNSEIVELLRNQTFAILNIPIGTDGSVEAEISRMGQQSGTASALFSTNPAQFISPGGENVEAYHAHRELVLKDIFRQANVPYENDSRDAESAESRRLKRTDQEQALKSYALELQRAERRLTELAYIAIEGPERGPKQMEDDGCAITYPSTFQPIDVKELLDDIAAALAVDCGETAQKELKKKLVRVMLTDASKTQLTDIDEEIDQQAYVSEEDKRQEQMELAAKPKGFAA